MNVSEFYKSLFGEKVYKLSLDAGCTCPTRDGTKGSGGCIFCSAAGSGDFAASRQLSIAQQVEQAKVLLSPKLKGREVKYIAYFQNFTNTYGDIAQLKKKWQEALNCKNVVGLALGTRPDCLGSDVLQALKEISKHSFLQIELGLQTSCQTSAQYIRRGFKNEVYAQAVKSLHEVDPNIHVVTHIIFGLPGECRQQMIDSVRYALECGTDGIKITNLYVLMGTDLNSDYQAGKFKTLEMDEYLDLIKEVLVIIPQNIVVHRLTGDPPKSQVVAPLWCCDKKRTMNEVKSLLE